MSTPDATLQHTALYNLHQELGAKLVPFAGYAMPVQYPAGIMAEHRHTREKAGLFDVSHMGQVILSGNNVEAALEKLVPGNIVDLAPGRIRYSLFTNAQGGILDDLMITRRQDDLFLVVNAACKTQDLEHLRRYLHADISIKLLTTQALLALQGPCAAAVMERVADGFNAAQPFMSMASVQIAGVGCDISRSGYTGEDGFEISMPSDQAETVARALLADRDVAPVGLGARDSLRLEAGLCLYGHDITSETTPVEAALSWAIGKRRRMEGGFPGADIIQQQLTGMAGRQRVGIRLGGRAPAREGAEIVDKDGQVIGRVTSGGFSPSMGCPIAMGYVDAPHFQAGQNVGLRVRQKTLPGQIIDLPFIPHRYYR
ncbi:MAG: glycine cleavage system protein T [Kordiimonas sp.]|nr:glycine cleavage system protein T [Kordiimonas sp.]